MSEPLLEVRNLRVEFDAGRGLFRRKRFAAVEDLSFELRAGETVGLVGESGSGKSSLARALLKLLPAARGQVLWSGEDLTALSGAALRMRRRDMQIVFQDAPSSLDPRMQIGDILAEPLKIFEGSAGARERAARVARMLERVGLSPRMTNRYPHEFSGGQCQRIGIARAMMSNPKLLICDEAVSSLDVSIQGQIVNLLQDLQRETGMAMLFISHNLAVVRQISRRVLVMYRGRLVEAAPRDALFAAPLHPYTRALIAAVLSPDEAPAHIAAEPVDDEPLRSSGALAGCAFRSRCAYAAPVCGERPPRLEAAAEEHLVSCHRHAELAAVNTPPT